MSRPLALVVDDEPDIRELVSLTLEMMDIDCHPAADLATARKAVQGQRLDFCLTDMRLPDGSGIELVEYIARRAPSVPVAVITAHGSMDSAVAALKAGAFDFVSKPLDLKVLRNLVQTALRLGVGGAPSGRRLLGDSEQMQAVRATVAKLARSQAPVYISGESGTGKELVARLIHESGPRSGEPFIAVNCGAIPSELMESELFGHKRGSFTGATSDNPGLFKAAQGGTLFLDEVADLPLPMQVKLLRAIQEKRIRPVGASEEVPVDVRILSASHSDLDALVASEQFRQDLYYRLNVINLHVPPLRERSGDIPELAGHIIERLAGNHSEALPQLGADALAALIAYPFPGNVRELENLLERALTLCEGGVIGAAELGLGNASHQGTVVGGGSGQLPGSAMSGDGLSESGAPPAAGDDAKGLQSMLEDMERRTITEALEQVRWNKTAAARRLGISFGALRYRMQKLGLD